ncbi:MAG: L-rhamnose mutarotase [Balneolaceae bacterium]
MKLKPGCEEEYKKRHDEIWPELLQALKDAGIHDYSIFLDEETGTLIAVQKLEEDHSAGRLPELPVMQKWWDHMKDLMTVHPDHSPEVTYLRKVFHMD